MKALVEERAAWNGKAAKRMSTGRMLGWFLIARLSRVVVPCAGTVPIC